MSDISTLNQLLARAARTSRTLTYLEGENQERSLSFAQLEQRALGILFHLQKLGARPGDKLIVFIADNEPFIDAFWAAVLGGIVPVPVAVGISDEHRQKLLRIARQLGDPYIYTDRKALARITSFAEANGASDIAAALRRRAFLVDDLQDVSRAGAAHAAQPSDTGFIQFSSGSTSEPKGVVLTHANLIANWRGAEAAGGFTPDDTTLSWMPLTHDMGLIGMHIFMIGSGCQVVQMPTELFIRRPVLWLQAASRKRASILCSPNFGYRHYLKVLGDRAVDELDLSAVRIIFNGAEPISVPLAQEFLTRLEPARLKRQAMFPVYGLAEASVAVSFPKPGAALRPLAFNRHRMAAGQTAELVAASSTDALELMSVGRAIPNCELRIADDQDAPLAERHFGHIQIRGGNVTAGYFGTTPANDSLHTADGWVRTGDLGVLVDGDLFVSGRFKEIIFVNGQNYYPHDLESIAIRASGMELGKVVVTGLRPPGAATDAIVVFALHRGEVREFLPVATEIARLLNTETGLEITAVVPIKRVPKTTSGKIQRHLLETEYLDGAYQTELAELDALREAARGSAGISASELEERIRAICDAALEGKNLRVDDNLFEIGASSLKLIEIHEQIDAQWPGQIDLTELFDFPTIRELSAHLATKLAAQA
jgi:acyl-CoA synthetase (AMP-forming)/AMP-acid ligase II/aryl carrier-like protein